MIDVIIVLICLAVAGFIFFRRWMLVEKIHLFGKMVLKKGQQWVPRLSKEDVEVTVKEMIPDAVSVDPKLAIKGENLFKKAELIWKKGDMEEAERLYIRAISLNPAHIESHSKLGVIYLNQKQFGKAEMIFRKLIVALPEEVSYLSNLGCSLYNQEKFDEAKGFYEKAITIDNSRAGRYFSLANINYALDDIEEAFNNLKIALDLDPDNIEYGLTLAHWYIEKNMAKDAREILERIVKHWPENVEAKNMLSDLARPKNLQE